MDMGSNAERCSFGSVGREANKSMGDVVSIPTVAEFFSLFLSDSNKLTLFIYSSFYYSTYLLQTLSDKSVLDR